ncbi:MAG: cation transporter [Planctomycetes bacterium]|nr:cation transporter [Planctomycetota bacterium]
MKKFSLLFAVAIVAASPVLVPAADVSLSGTHLCCGGCAKSVAKVLGGITGVEDAACDLKTKTVTFKAAEADIAKKALRALAKAGFYGTAKVDGKAVKFPAQKIKKGTKNDTVVLRGVHICCGQCIKAIAAAVKGVSGVESPACNKKKRTVTLTGKDIDVAAAIAALNKAGFSARYKTKKKK